jgi:tRNA(Ile)-lysidine synthase
MDALGPFENAPHVAVAVSGGADSVALCVLAQRWVLQQGGRITALTVDHGLRRGSAGEARQVGDRLRPLGIAHHILPWSGAKPASAVQAAARAARYRLLCAFCREAGILHLLLGHQAHDEAETLLIRLLRGSDPAGLAGIAPLIETPWCRILRPLLGWTPDRLRQVVAAAGVRWIDDPSNDDPRFTRTVCRQVLPLLDLAGAGFSRLECLKELSGAARRATEDVVRDILINACRWHNAGCVWIDWPVLNAVDRRWWGPLLARLCGVIGGSPWPLSSAAVRRLCTWLDGAQPGAAYGIGRCLLRRQRLSLFLQREIRSLPPPRPVSATGREYWDGRFFADITMGPRPRGDEPLVLRAAGTLPPGCSHPAWDNAQHDGIPKSVWPTLPVLADAKGIVSLPHLSGCSSSDPLQTALRLEFRSRFRFSGDGYFLISKRTGMIC